MCDKVKYDKKGAQTALNSITRQKHKRWRKKKEVRYYHCPLCNGWHLTSRA